jgi:hypothetical protein
MMAQVAVALGGLRRQCPAAPGQRAKKATKPGLEVVIIISPTENEERQYNRQKADYPLQDFFERVCAMLQIWITDHVPGHPEDDPNQR